MPPEDCSHDRGHKFPFLANQIFMEGGKGVEAIVDNFFYTVVPQTTMENDDPHAEQQQLDASLPKPSNPFKTMGP